MNCNAPAGTSGHLIRGGHMVEEYSDGSERVFFTDEEWAAMCADPVRFGLVACRQLHPLSALLSDGSCGMCEDEGDREEMEGMYAEEALPADHPAFWCDRCGSYHSGECPPEDDNDEVPF